ncbi:MAG: YfaZ family protein [Sulfurimonas sp.]|uniref:YfaZ family outer membrane protein n=1 Tax=Sulfurimonas sp. TaxID=2022749 RepID=UPI00260E8C13|nr:YfaZ family outer membrane protein [Sulfurimonas sp.]MCW8896113.1 YfaZ family protein [Sulfurimonas sp.]MCW8954522.1 YfaZ family protein [Sulfurimonas sp.]
MLKKFGLIAASAVSVFAMHSAEINVNNSDLELGVKFDVGQFDDAVEPETMFFGAKYINADEKHSDFSNIDDYQELNFLMQREVDSGFTLGLGVKLNHTKNFVSVPLGVEASYKLPANIQIPFYINGSLYYAPEVLSYDNADGFSEFRISLDAEVIENGRVTVGYRSLETDYDNTRRHDKYNSSVYLGFKFAF